LGSVVEAYIDFLYRALGSKEASRVLEIEPGRIVLRGSARELFTHPHVVLWHRFVVEELPKHVSRVVLLLPCSSIKPYSLSPTHRIAMSRLSRRGVLERVSVLVLSEPMVLVPIELDVYYPFANYDLPPRALDDESRRTMVMILARALERMRERVCTIVATLPRAHLAVFREACAIARVRDRVREVPYGALAFRSVALAADLAAEAVANAR